MRIFVQSWLTNEEKEYFRQVISDHEIVFASELPPAARKDAAFNSQVIFGNIPTGWIPHCHHLQWLQLDSTGINQYLDCTFSEHCQVTHLKGFYARPVAETAVGGILALYRKLDELVRLKEERRWNYKAIRPAIHLLHEKKVLIIGGGAIGMQIKKLLAAFDCTITVFSRSKPPADFTDPDLLEKVIADSDIIVNCLPETPATIMLLDKKKLDKFSPEAVFVNVGRGSVVDEPYLISLLNAHKIAGAVIDVTQVEPLPADNPWWNCPNTILSQHTSGGFVNEGLQKIKIFLENLKRFQQNEPLQGMVNYDKGY